MHRTAWLSVFAAFPIALAACASALPAPVPHSQEAGDGAPAGEIADSPHIIGTNLPRWAACLFPQNANPGAVRRAQPCPAEPHFTRAYKLSEVAGCWTIDKDDAPDGGSDWITRAAIELTRHPFPGSYSKGELAVRLAPSTSSREDRDGRYLGLRWHFSPPDSISIYRTDGLVVFEASFRVRGDKLVGMERHFTDVVRHSTDTLPDNIPRLSGIRVPCTPLTR
jgi:hypothetical protein